MARSSECTEQYAQKVLDRDPHCQRRLITSFVVNYTPRSGANPMRISLLPTFLFVVTLTCVIISTQAWMTAQSEHSPQTPAEYWLSLSAEAKREYVHGYLFGFDRGKRSACYFYAEKITPYLSHESLPPEKLPSSVCQQSLPRFTESQNYDVYVDAITSYYKKYPLDRQGGVPLILDEMATPPGTTDIDVIHSKLK
jgi:hypothetical protein